MGNELNLTFEHLCDVPEMLPVLEAWFVREWEPWYGPNGAGDAQRDLTACKSRDSLPICLVALDSQRNIMGTATLKVDSVGSELGVGPWLAAVLVAKAHQGKGIGTALVEAVEKEAERLGFDAIYTSTDTAGRIMARRGWSTFGKTQSLTGPLVVYRWVAERS